MFLSRYFGLLVLSALFLLPLSLSAQETQDPKDAQGCFCLGMRGNVNCDFNDEVTLSDLTLLVDHLFISSVALPNPDEANANADPAGVISVSDLAYLIDYLYITHTELPHCPEPYNTPPITIIEGNLGNGVPVINSVVPTFASTGLRMRWTAEDIVDHPDDDPNFEYEWRLYGPYTDSTFDQIETEFLKKVFVTTEGEVFEFGSTDSTCWVDTVIDEWSMPPDTTFADRCIIGDFFVRCDTAYVHGRRVIDCDTILVNTIFRPNAFGRIDTLFDVVDPDFENNADFNKIVDHSQNDMFPSDEWVPDTRDSAFNLFATVPSDTALQMKFMFWVRAREQQAPEVIDPVPAFASVEVIDPKLNRTVLVVNMTVRSQNHVHADSLRAYWHETLSSWLSSRPEIGGEFDSTLDYFFDFEIQQSPGLLKLLLGYKSIIVVNDSERLSVWNHHHTNFPQSVQMVMDVGVNVWVCARVPLGRPSFGSPGASYLADPDYRFYFGAEQYTFSGWGRYLIFSNQRIEHFIGAIPIAPAEWPALEIDSSLLHSRYKWSLGWVDSLAALPEVGWMVRTFETEVLYLYESLYGQNHFLGNDFSYHGRPVAIRLDRGVFRSASTLFTPVALKQPAGQQFVDKLMDWLIEPHVPKAQKGELSLPQGDIGNEGGR